MATGLVASIHEGTDTPVTLVGGHDGIYEVTVDGNLIYTNQGSCSQGFPDQAELAAQIAGRLGLEWSHASALTSEATSDDGPSCALPGESGTSTPQPEFDSSCGCSSTETQTSEPEGGCCGPAPVAADNEGCCGPADTAEPTTTGCCAPATADSTSCG